MLTITLDALGTLWQLLAMVIYAILTVIISFGASQEVSLLLSSWFPTDMLYFQSWAIMWPNFTSTVQEWKLLDIDFGKLALDTLTGPVPAALTALVRFVMPALIEWFGNTQKPLTYSFRDRRVVYWLFNACVVLN